MEPTTPAPDRAVGPMGDPHDSAASDTHPRRRAGAVGAGPGDGAPTPADGSANVIRHPPSLEAAPAPARAWSPVTDPGSTDHGRMGRSRKHAETAAGWLINFAALYVVLAASFVLTFSYLFDLRAPLNIHSIELLTPVIERGGTVHYRVVYSKREGCAPPLGGGQVSYLFEQLGVDEGMLGRKRFQGRVLRVAAWPAGMRIRGKGAAGASMNMPSGAYLLRATATYECKGAPYPMSVRTPPMRVVVR